MISSLFVAVNSALLGRTLFYSYKLFLDGLYFTWEDQSDAVYRNVHTILINYIAVLYESYITVMCLIGQIQCSYAENLLRNVM